MISGAKFMELFFAKYSAEILFCNFGHFYHPRSATGSKLMRFTSISDQWMSDVMFLMRFSHSSKIFSHKT